ncbi:MAG: cadmium-translocating P-type ATPase [Clostridiales bacterium]|nr:cadmium-translocating P-type ATPase [Clostridiales bacterium]MCF8023001.1 cadmium-translocating P-type ATPase [Clostridiales bacterium]
MTKDCGQKCNCQHEHVHEDYDHDENHKKQYNHVGETLILDGFQCVDCAEKVQEKLSELKEVSRVELNSRRAQIELEYDSSLIDSNAILDLVESKGYQCEIHAASSESNKTIFQLEGLDCADCAVKLERKVKNMEGVNKASVNFGASKMTVEHLVPWKDIIKTVKQMGYDASIDKRTQSEQMDTFRLEGLDCADCASKLEKSIQQLPGVKDAKVNFGASKMTVEHGTSVDKILKAIDHAGYNAGVETSGAKSRSSTFRLSGLDCADCAAKLEKRLASIPGVESVEVNFGAAKMNAKHTAGVEEIIQVAEEAGYKAEFAEIGEGPRKKEKPFYKDTKTIFTGISGLFLAAGFLVSFLKIPGQVVTGLFLGAMITGGLFVARSALYSLKSISLDMNVLMSVAVIGAAAIGEWGEGATVVFLFSLGNALQAYSMEKTRNSIRELMELSPREALVRRNGREITLPVEEIAVGDVIIVKPGERIAMDGKVVTGASVVNQAPITGESMPVEKMPGAEAFAGTVNEEGSLEIEVSTLVQDTTLAKIIDMVEEAQAQRAPSQQFVDVFARYYTPAVIGIAAAIAVIPPLGMGLSFTPWLEKALILLVIACPCALVISTPVSIVSAIGSAAKRGVLIKGGAYLEEAGALKIIAFDKTGTLTEGRPEVTDVINLNSSGEQEMLSIAAAVEKRSQHPMAKAIIRCAGQKEIEPRESEDFQSVTAKGAGAIINGQRHYVGNIKLFKDLQVKNLPDPSLLGKLQKEGKTTILVGTGREIAGVIAVADRSRSNTASTLQALKKAGVDKTVMLTGDNTGTARVMASQLGVDEFKSELFPEDKLVTIKELQDGYGKVAMVGDGINDSPALAAANVGIAMGGAGTDTAMETADIVLMADDLSKLPYAIDLSRRALRIIKQNIAFALLVKAVFIVGTFMGITNLWMAVFADTGAALIVIANGMRLMRVKEKAA